MKQLNDGIYFNLDADKYHAQERMSASGICNMLVSPPTFWANSWLNPDREEANKDTSARILGRAYHTARLEPHLLDQQFVCEINVDDYEGLLTNSTEIATQLDKLGEPKNKSGEKVLDKALRLKEAGYSGPILHLLQEQWEENRGERTGIAAKYWKQLQADIELIRAQPEINKHLTGGFAEVSVLWTDSATGTKMKCRFDYLKAGGITDFKTFDNSMRKNIEQCIHDTFRYNRYYVQAYIYWLVAEMIRKGEISSMTLHDASPEQSAMIEDMIRRIEPTEVWYVFQEKSGVPNLLAREVHIMTPVHPSHEHNDAGVSRETSIEVAQKTRRLSSLGLLAEMEVTQSIRMYNYYCETYERGKPWGSMTPTGVINDDCFPPYWLGLDQ